MKVSIIVALYNKEKWIESTIKSVINQKYEDWELIIVDDGSTDSSGDIADKYASEDNRIVVYHRENHGISDTRYWGYEHSSGEWITVLDADDYLHPMFLQEMLSTSNADTIVGGICFGKKECKKNRDNIMQEQPNEKITLEDLKDNGSLEQINIDIERLVGRVTRRETFDKALSISRKYIEQIPHNYFEDVILAPLINLSSNRITLVNRKMYFARVIEGSHSRTHDINISQCEQIKAAEILLIYYKNNGYNALFSRMLPNFYLVMLKVYYFLLAQKRISNELSCYQKYIEELFVAYFDDYQKSNKGSTNKLCVFLFVHNQFIWKKIMKIYFGRMYVYFKLQG